MGGFEEEEEKDHLQCAGAPAAAAPNGLLPVVIPDDDVFGIDDLDDGFQ